MSRRLRNIVQGIVQTALASSSIASCATVESHGPGSGSVGSAIEAGAPDGGDAGAFADEATFACNAPLADIFSNLTPSAPIDYIELRTQTLDYSKSPVALTALTTVSSLGTACKTAANPTQCMTALGNATLPDDPDSVDAGWIPGGNPSYSKPPAYPDSCCINDRAFLVVTAGDTVSPLFTTADVARVFAPIDTLEEARLLASTQTMLLDCAPGVYRQGWKKNDDGSWELLVTFEGCASHNRRRVHVAIDGTVTIVAQEYQSVGMCGRRPAGLVETRQSAASAVAAFVASSAHLEAASVLAFRRLEHELVSHDAPPDLVRRTRQARRDEIRHARDMSHLARDLGADVPPVEVTDVGARDLLSIAIENAVEGCTLETYGAIVATFQAERSAPEHRQLLRRIARDEVRHAELARDVAAWLDTKLTDEERARVEVARAEALESLRARLEAEPPHDLVTKLGIPTRAEAASLLAGFESRLAMN